MTAPSQLAVVNKQMQLLPLESAEVVLDDKQKASVDNYFESQRHGPVVTGFKVCKVQECCSYTRCPYVQAQVDMEQIRGEYCPVEQREVQTWMNDMAAALGVDPEDTMTLEMVRTYAMTLLEEKRIREAMAEAPLIIETFRGVSHQGETLWEPKSHPLQTSLKEIMKSKSTQLKQLMATPEMKAKDKGNQVKTLSEMMQELKDTLKRPDSTPVQILEETPVEDWDAIDKMKAGLIRSESVDIKEKEIEVNRRRAEKEESAPSIPEVPEGLLEEPFNE